jgi:hypothetical protein
MGTVLPWSWKMCRQLEYRVSRKAKYVVTRLERRVEGDGRQSGSIRVVGQYETAVEAERARTALQRDEDRPAPKPPDRGT